MKGRISKKSTIKKVAVRLALNEGIKSKNEHKLIKQIDRDLIDIGNNDLIDFKDMLDYSWRLF